MLSPKQIEILRWPYTGKRALICDGAVRAGKTSVMSLSFLLWAMGNFERRNFGICGKTVSSAERNVIQPLQNVAYLAQNGFALEYTRSGHVLTVARGKRVNTFYVFGGRDESSYMLIQGVTLAGILLDEAAQMILNGECGVFSPVILDCFQQAKDKFFKATKGELSFADIK